MFAVYVAILLILGYTAPAVALYPRLLLSSRTAIAVPFVSIAVIGVARTVLVASGLYTRLAVASLSAALLLLAVARLVRVLRRAGRSEFHWPVSHGFLLTVSLLLGVYWGADLATTGFDTDDEIYSCRLKPVAGAMGSCGIRGTRQ